MRIGLDLDHTVYGYPEFFQQMIKLMSEAGHQFLCTSGHPREQWDSKDIKLLNALGINVDQFSPELLSSSEEAGIKPGKSSIKRKIAMSKELDFMFDDDQKLLGKTECPLFVCDKTKSKHKKIMNKIAQSVRQWQS